jgi:23S rRNA pseudouridine1911/1915/1917 synthase
MDEAAASRGATANGRLEIVVPPERGGERIDRALAALLADHSRSQIQRLIEEGRVTAGGARVSRPSRPVAGGEVIVVDLPPTAPATPVPQPLPLRILHEDADIVVVDKPAGMVVHPAAGHQEGTLVNALLHHVRDLSGIGGRARPGIVHRLDRGTSGVLVVAKHDRAHQALVRQFSGREVVKEYLALVWGNVQAGRRIEAAIGRDPRHRQRMSTRAPRARAAATEIVSAEPLHGVTFVRLAIATGRTHQIRVHMQAIGHPVVGDPVYGGVRRRVPPSLAAVQRLARPFLHAARLAFRHPAGGQRVQFEAPLPEDLAAVLEALRRRGSAATAPP